MKKRAILPSLFCICVFAAGLWDCNYVYADQSSKKYLDASSKEDWETNCALRYKYGNELIFTVSYGKNGTSMAADDRNSYLSLFKEFKFDSVPDLKTRRERVLQMINSSPGGNKVIISTKLNQQVEVLMKEVVEHAASHGVKCQE